MNIRDLSTNDEPVTMRTSNKSQSEAIARDVDKFLRAGGKITKCGSQQNYQTRSSRFCINADGWGAGYEQ